jgi:DNA-binding CsgD family transcriptional regulator
MVFPPTETSDMTSNDITTTAAQVHIRVAHDHDAGRISAVLEALGYTVLRELDEGDGPARLRWAVDRLAHRHNLTKREQGMLERVLSGRTNQQISEELEISRATVKWHMHNVFAKTNTGNRESLLRLALQLGGGPEPTIEPIPASAPFSQHTSQTTSQTTSQLNRAPTVVKHREPSGVWRGPDEITARIDFDQPRVPAAESIPSKSYC